MIRYWTDTSEIEAAKEELNNALCRLFEARETLNVAALTAEIAARNLSRLRQQMLPLSESERTP